MTFLKKSLNRFRESTLIKGTLILTAAGFATRITGFLFRIFLTDKIGAEGLGIYQLIFPVQIICYSLCTVGFETAISKMTAASTHHSAVPSRKYLKYGLMISFIFSVIIAVLLYYGADLLCAHVLFEKRCRILLKALAFSVPLASIHACICGYYIGCKNTKITAISQIIEQLARVISIVIIISYVENNRGTATPLCAVIGSVLGELIATLFCVMHILRNPHHIRNIRTAKKDRHERFFRKTLSTISSSHGHAQELVLRTKKSRVIKELCTLALPVSLNRLMLSVLQSIQSILIPSMLMLYGYSQEKALSVYGILLGLVIPFLLFPGAFINSLSLVLLPAISQADSAGNQTGIRATTEKTLQFCCVFGIFCAGTFLVCGKELGRLLLSDKEAGTYLSLLGIICPFIYITSTLASIINGLGKTTVTFLVSAAATILQIAAIVTLMPVYGINGYIWGFLGSNIFNAVCLYLYIKKQLHCTLHPLSSIAYPLFVSFLVLKGTEILFSYIFPQMTLPLLAGFLALTTCLYGVLIKDTRH